MPRDGSGVYTLPAGNPVVTNTVIASTWANTTLSDIAAQLNNVFTRDGLLGPTAPFKIVDGTAAAPGLAFNSEPGLGWYRPTAGQIQMAQGGAARMSFNFTSAGVTAVATYPNVAGESHMSVYGGPGATGTSVDLFAKSDGTSGVQTAGNLDLNGAMVRVMGATGGMTMFGVDNSPSTSRIAFAFRSDGKIGLRIDATQFGYLWPINVSGMDSVINWGFVGGDFKKPYMRGLDNNVYQLIRSLDNVLGMLQYDAGNHKINVYDSAGNYLGGLPLGS